MNYDTYGLIADCGCCQEGSLKRLVKQGIDPLSVEGIDIVADAIAELNATVEEKMVYLQKHLLDAYYFAKFKTLED